jgi:hypothetical protein
MGLFDNFIKGGSNNKEPFPINLYNQIINDVGKNFIVLTIEMDKPFLSPPFDGSRRKAIRGNQTFYTKMFSGTLTLTKEYLKLDNSSKIHKPQFETDNDIELDYTLTIYMTSDDWTFEYFDKNSQKTTIMAFEQFLYYGGSK